MAIRVVLVMASALTWPHKTNQLRRKTMGVLDIIAVVALVVIGVVIYINKTKEK